MIALGLDPAKQAKASGLLSSSVIRRQPRHGVRPVERSQRLLGTAHLEKAGDVLGGDFNYWDTVLEGRAYLALHVQRSWPCRLRGGSINGSDNQSTDVPFFKRYFLGGASSLRGWGRFEVSPLSGGGEPVGGATQLEGSAELRVPVWKDLSAVAFVDAGNVWADAWSFKLGDIRYDVGPGIRYNTPVGAFRVDVGYQLNPIPGLIINGEPEKRHYRIHFSIGQAF